MIYLNRMRVRRSKNVAFAGRLTNFTVNSSKRQVSANAKITNIVDNAIILPACLFVGLGELTHAVRAADQTIYRLKESLYEDYLRREIEKLSIVVNFA